MKKFMAFVCLCFVTAVFSVPCVADEVIRIEVGRDYDHYSNKELRRRVYLLEKAVEQLQVRVFQLEWQTPKPVANEWTCHIQSFGKTYVASESTRAKALAKVLSSCGENTHAMHCEEKDVKCDNK